MEMRAHSPDPLIELDRELGDVLRAAGGLLYYVIVTPAFLDGAALQGIIGEANIEAENADGVTDFLLYYGFLGIRSEEAGFFVFNVAYDLMALRGDQARRCQHALTHQARLRLAPISKGVQEGHRRFLHADAYALIYKPRWARESRSIKLASIAADMMILAVPGHIPGGQ